MKKKLLWAIMGCIVLNSCSKNIALKNLKIENDYRNFYIVDTIKIVNPVRIHSDKFGGQFIVSRDSIKNYKRRIDFFYQPYVYLLGDDIFRASDPKDWSTIKYPDNGGCNFEKSKLENIELEIYEFNNETTVFILGLISARYYFEKFNSYNSFNFEKKNYINSYIKIVYPLCSKRI